MLGLDPDQYRALMVTRMKEQLRLHFYGHSSSDTLPTKDIYKTDQMITTPDLDSGDNESTNWYHNRR